MNKISLLITASLLIAFQLQAQFNFRITSDKSEIALYNVTIIDRKGSQPLNGQVILIKDGRISDIFEKGSKEIPGTSKKIDFTGYYVIPGLIDAHYHFLTSIHSKPRQDSLLTYAFLGGVTAFRDMSGDAIDLSELSKKSEAKILPYPRIYYSALFAGKSWFDNDRRASMIMHKLPSGTAPWAKAINDTTNLEVAIKEAKEQGVTGIKIYADMGAEKVKEITNEAHKQGLKVWSHATVFPAKPSDAINANVDALSHSVEFTWELEENIPIAFDKRPGDYYKVMEWDKFQFDNPKIIALLDSMKAKGTMLDATASHAHTRYIMRQLTQPEDKRAIRYPLKMDAWVNGFTNLAYRRGVKILTGTDYQENPEKFDFPNIHAEMEYLVKNCGMSEIDVIRSATLNAAEILNISNDYGSVEIGKRADLLILKRNPVNDIANTKSILFVVKDGVIFKGK